METSCSGGSPRDFISVSQAATASIAWRSRWAHWLSASMSSASVRWVGILVLNRQLLARERRERTRASSFATASEEVRPRWKSLIAKPPQNLHNAQGPTNPYSVRHHHG